MMSLSEVEMRELYSDPVARKAVARCIELIREQRNDYLSEEYCADQPMCSFSERFVLDQMAVTLENQLALGTLEQCSLLNNPTPFELYRAASADTRPEGGDSTQIEAPSETSGAVPKADAQ
jgi:hypothetical protein